MKKNNKVTTQKNRELKYSIEMLVSTLLTSYFLVSFFNLLIHFNDTIYYTDKSFLQSGLTGAGLFAHIATILVVAATLTLLEYFLPRLKITAYTMFFSAFALSALIAGKAGDNKYYVYALVVAIMAIVVLYVVKKECFCFITKDFSSKYVWGTAALFALVFGFFIGAVGVYRYLTYSSPNFDFGIWCQMFYNMAENGQPLTTVERYFEMSHFGVHFSPIYYLMLPIYFIFRSPITLQILQVVILYSGIVPLVLLARKKGMSGNLMIVIAAIYAAFPAIGSGTFYDLHENCFLLPLLLWVFYFYESDKYIPLAVFCLLTLAVKEDAFIYLLFFAIYVFFSDKKWKVALPVGAFAIAYFLVVTSLINKYGDGVMINRFDDLIYNPEDGLFGAVKTLIMNPGYVIQVFVEPTTISRDKILYLLLMFIPLGFMPFATKKISRLLLIAPVLLNTLTTYAYQPDIEFQYSFGIIAFLFYLTVLNASEFKGFTKRYVPFVSIVASLLLFSVICLPKFGNYVERYDKYRDIYDRFDYALSEVIPEDASVAASSSLIAHIAERDELYEIKVMYNHDKYGTYVPEIKQYLYLGTDYVALRTSDTNAEEYCKFYLENGYEKEYVDSKGYIMILKKVE